MPRCTMSDPPSHSSSRYLPRRTSRFTSRPTTRRAKFRGTRRRRLGLRTATPVMVLPSTKGSMPRRVISTSGSSGIEALIVLSGPGNIPKLALHDSRHLRMSDPTGFLLVPFGALRLLAEIAGQRGNLGLSAQAYVDLAKRTRDPRIARRATEVALYARMNGAAID